MVLQLDTTLNTEDHVQRLNMVRKSPFSFLIAELTMTCRDFGYREWMTWVRLFNTEATQRHLLISSYSQPRAAQRPESRPGGCLGFSK
jgi:hypothetical protein